MGHLTTRRVVHHRMGQSNAEVIPHKDNRRKNAKNFHPHEILMITEDTEITEGRNRNNPHRKDDAPPSLSRGKEGRVREVQQ